MCNTGSECGAAAQHRELSSGLRDDLEGGVAGRPKRKAMYAHVKLIHFVAQQKLTQHCKAIILH